MRTLADLEALADHIGKLETAGEKVLAAGRELDGSTHDGYPEVDRG
jgi:hypothetical protein